MLPAALPEYLSLGWPEPSAGKAAVRCREQVPELSALRSRPQIVTSWISPQHPSPGTALSSPQPRSPVVPARLGEDGPVTPAPGGRAEQLLCVGLSPFPAEKGTLLPSRYQLSLNNPLGNDIAENWNHLIQVHFHATMAWRCQGLGHLHFSYSSCLQGL